MNRSEGPEREEYPIYPSHFRPRSRVGWAVLLCFLALFAMTQPPAVHSLANRVEPWILGLPFLYAYLLGLYVLLIGVLVWAMRRDL